MNLFAVNEPGGWALRAIIGACAALALYGCQTTAPAPPERPGEPPPAAVPAGAIERCFALAAQQSELRFLVHKDGPLARLGHNHVLTGNGLTGRLAVGPPGEPSAMRLRFAVDSLVVDPPPARAEEGGDFTGDVSEEARQGTRSNLLGKQVLDAERYPYIDAELVSHSGPPWAPDTQVRIRLLDQTRVVPVSLGVWQEDDRIIVQASFHVHQTEFGLQPFSVLGGGLRVADDVGIRVKLVFVANGERDPARCVLPFEALTNAGSK